MKIEIDLRATQICPDIHLEIRFDDQCVANLTAIDTIQTVTLSLSDSAQEHVLQLVMQGKNKTHTRLDDQGQILDDVAFLIERLEFEDLDMRPIFCQGLCCYTHNGNGTLQEFLDEFYGYMGCNGRVEMRFTTPIFLWLADQVD